MAKKSRNTTTVLDRPVPDNLKTMTNSKKVTKRTEDRTPIAADDDELELEKLVFGDISGFKESLRRNGDDEEFLSVGSDDESSGGKGEEEETGLGRDLTALHDDEVGCKFIRFECCAQLTEILTSYFLRMLVQAMSGLPLSPARVPQLLSRPQPIP